MQALENQHIVILFKHYYYSETHFFFLLFIYLTNILNINKQCWSFLYGLYWLFCPLSSTDEDFYYILC